MAKKLPFDLSTVTNDPEKKKQLDGFVSEIALCRRKQRQEAEAVADIRREAKEALGIPPGLLNKLVIEQLDPGKLEAQQAEIEAAIELHHDINE
jgi:hypothetical protein